MPVPGKVPLFFAGPNSTRSNAGSNAGTGITAGVPGIMPVWGPGARE